VNETFSSQLGQRLREARETLGLTQIAAAELVGVTREHWGRCERGFAVPGGEILSALAAAGADVNYILTGKRAALDGGGNYSQHQAAPLSVQERALVDNYRHAGEAGQKAIEHTSAAFAQMQGQSQGSKKPREG
jgi:transcriptional regulator with XRE-family HTH domain